MRADEPALLDFLVLGLHFGPQRGLEVRAMLVRGDGVVGVIDDLTELGVVPAVEAAAEGNPGDRYAQLAHGVPHADEMHADLVRVGRAEGDRFRMIGSDLLVAVQRVGGLDALRVHRLQHTAFANEADEAARAVGAAAEAEHEQAVDLRLEGLGDPRIAGLDVLRQAAAEKAAGQPVVPARAHALEVAAGLREVVLAARVDRLAHAHHIGLVLRVVPGAVEQHDDVALHFPPSLRLR